MKSLLGIHQLVLVGLFALTGACSRSDRTGVPLPISLQHAETVLYCEMVRLSDSESVYIVREVWRQGPSASRQYTAGDAVTLFEPLDAPGSFAVIHFGGDDGVWWDGITSVDGGKVTISMQVSVSELRRAIRDNIAPEGAKLLPFELVRDPHGADLTIDDEVSAEIAEMQRQILRDVRPGNPTTWLASLQDSIARQQEYVDAARIALEGAETESELRRAHRDLEWQQHFLEALENRLREEMAKQN